MYSFSNLVNPMFKQHDQRINKILNSSASSSTWTTHKPPYIDPNNRPVTFDDFFKIVIVLDESGSMMPIREQIVNSINNLITEQKQIKSRPATFTLIKFNHNITRKITNRFLSDIDPLSYHDYDPSGTTALYDAIGDTIQWFRNEKDVLMVIVTDGQENSSKKYTRMQINKMIDDKKKNNKWTYVYLSSDLNTEIQGNNIGLQTSKYASNCCVAQNNYGNFIGQTLNSAISNCRKNGISVQAQL